MSISPEETLMSSSSSVTAHDETVSSATKLTEAARVPESAHLSPSHSSSSNGTALGDTAETTLRHDGKTSLPSDNKVKHDVAGSQTSEVPEMEELPRSNSNKPNFKKGRAFWMIMISLAMSMFLSALDLTALSTALPRIATDLQSENFTWIGSAYALASTAFLPVFGGVASGFGRKPVLLAAILIFAVGSAICGSATNMDQMIAGRTVQGVGGGGILAMAEIVVADLVPLAERGVFLGLLGLVWAISSAIGPVMGGALASNWRWLFYLNLPISGVAFALVLFFMHLKLPTGTITEKLARLDWLGNLLFVTSSTIIILGLTWGGDAYAWDSAAVLVPLIVGVIMMAAFFYYEAKWAKNPIVPFELLSNRNTLSGYGTTFLHGIVSIAAIYYLPAWFQGVKGHSPIRTGVDLFPIAFLIAPMAIATGISVTVTQKFVVQNWVAWIFCIVGCGLLVILQANSPESAAHGLQVVLAIGLGILYASVNFPVLAPLPPSLNAEAMSFLAFARSFGQVLGIVIGSTTLSNQLKKRLPAEFVASLPGGPGSAYSSITEISSLPEPLRTQVRIALSDSIRYIWIVMIAFSALGLIVSLFQKAMPLSSVTDEAWGLVVKDETPDAKQEKSPENIV